MSRPDVRLVIHGHFYQPPRESPWTGDVPEQNSAAPHHDWNERITAECYQPNTASRVLDSGGRIERIVNNFEFMSFNIGPTLFAWLERHHPVVYERIVEADRKSRHRNAGHGNAIAQAYNHIILPLANARDRRTQVLWGLREFELRFGRRSEGLWLPETAIDPATVETLLDCGVRFVILAPHQAQRVRPLAGGEWHDASAGRIDPKQAYCIRGANPERSLAVFFYDGPISRAAAFDHLLHSADALADRLALAVQPQRRDVQLMSLALDGETFGHHSPFGDMCLAALFTQKAKQRGLQLTNYAAYLHESPPQHEVELAVGEHGDGTAWSCAHGVGRWQRDCGCAVARPPGWNQAWRAPLRAAFDALRDAVAVVFASRGAQLFHDPWAARDDYVDVVVRAHDGQVVEQFLARHLRHAAGQRVDALELLEAQRDAMAMYTSCAWFFDDVGGIESIQNLRFAARCVQRMHRHGPTDLEARLLSGLELARSNLASDSAASLYRRIVIPELRTPEHAAAARAIDLVLGLPSDSHRYGFDLSDDDRRAVDLGGHAAIAGHVSVCERQTHAAQGISYLAIEPKDSLPQCFTELGDRAQHADRMARLAASSTRFDTTELLQRLGALVGNGRFTVASLLRDERRLITHHMAAARVAALRQQYRMIYEQSQHLLEEFHALGLEIPAELRTPCALTLQADLLEAATTLHAPFDLNNLGSLDAVLGAGERFGVDLDLQPVAMIVEGHLTYMLAQLIEERDSARLDAVENLLQLAETRRLPLKLTVAQEIVHDLFDQRVSLVSRRGDADADRLAERLTRLATHLNFAPDAVADKVAAIARSR